MRLAAVTAALFTLPLLTPTVATAQLSRPKIDTVGGHVVRVMNPGPTAWVDTNGWKLVLERTIQPKDGEPGELENPEGISRLSNGQFVVTDRQVKLFDAAGRFIRTIGRGGQGPGEYKSPVVTLYRDTIVILDPQLARISLLTTSGQVVRTFTAFSNSVGYGTDVDDNGRVRVPVFTPKGNAWNIYSIAGKALDSIVLPLAAPPQEWRYGKGSMYGIPFAPYTIHRRLRDGSMLYGSTGTYQLILSRSGRDTARMFGRTGVTGAPIPAQLRDSMFNQIVGGAPEIKSIAKLSDVPKNYPLWSVPYEDGAGNIWIRSGGKWDGRHNFDVFNRDGRLLGTVPAPFTGWFTEFLGDRIGVIDTDDNDLPRIRIYRIDRRGK